VKNIRTASAFPFENLTYDEKDGGARSWEITEMHGVS
jgi:hypothetical protein